MKAVKILIALGFLCLIISNTQSQKFEKYLTWTGENYMDPGDQQQRLGCIFSDIKWAITGDYNHNMKLSLERAEKVASELQDKIIAVEGLGESGMLYDNTLPEGRFYNRTVKIIIETPIDDGTADI